MIPVLHQLEGGHDTRVGHGFQQVEAVLRVDTESDPPAFGRVAVLEEEPGRTELQLGPRSDIDGKSYMNVAGVNEEQVESIRESGWQADMLNSYILVKYRVEDDGLLLWAMDKDAKKEAIQYGKIKGEVKEGDGGTRIRFTDTTENLAKFVADAGDGLFADEPLQCERVR